MFETLLIGLIIGIINLLIYQYLISLTGKQMKQINISGYKQKLETIKWKRFVEKVDKEFKEANSAINKNTSLEPRNT